MVHPCVSCLFVVYVGLRLDLEFKRKSPSSEFWVLVSLWRVGDLNRRDSDCLLGTNREAEEIFFTSLITFFTTHRNALLISWKHV